MNRRKIIAVIAAFVALTGLACEADPKTGPEAKPEGKGTPVTNQTGPQINRPGCPDIDFRAPEERCFTLQTFVESRFGPYDVYLKIEGGNGAYPREIPQSGGGWKHAIVYATGKKLTITMTLHYEGTQSKEGFCSITDGGELVKQKLRSITAGGGSPYEAVCTLITSQ